MSHKISITISGENAKLIEAVKDSVIKLKELNFKMQETGDTAVVSGQKIETDFVQKLSSMKKALVGTLTAFGIGGLTKEIFDLNAEWESMSVAMETVTGSAESAKSALNWIQTFAKETPYELNEVNEAFIKLSAYGLDARNMLPMLGDTASSFGKTLNDSVEMMADAVNLEFERLKEFGIRASQTKDTVTFTWMEAGQEIKKTVAKDSEEVAAVLTHAFNRYAGGMEKQSQTAKGIISNIWDATKQFTMQSTNGLFEAVEKDLEGLLKKIDDLKKKGTLDIWAKNISSSLINLYNALKSLTPVIKLVITHGDLLFKMWAVAKIMAIVKAISSLALVLKSNLVVSLTLTALKTKELRTLLIMLAGEFKNAGVAAKIFGNSLNILASVWIVFAIEKMNQLIRKASEAKAALSSAANAKYNDAEGIRKSAADINKMSPNQLANTYNSKQLRNLKSNYEKKLAESKKQNSKITFGGIGLGKNSYDVLVFGKTIKNLNSALDIARRNNTKQQMNLVSNPSKIKNTQSNFLPTYTEINSSAPSSKGGAKGAKRQSAKDAAKEIATKMKAEREAYQEYLKQMSQEELENVKQELDHEQEYLDNSYAERKVSIEKYYQEKSKIIKSQYQAEIANLTNQKEIAEANLKRAESNEEERNIKTEILRLDGEISRTEKKMGYELEKMMQDKQKDIQDYKEKVMELKLQLENMNPGQTAMKTEEIKNKYKEILERAKAEDDTSTIDLIIKLQGADIAKMQLEEFFNEIDIMKQEMNDRITALNLDNIVDLEKEQKALDIKKETNAEIAKMIPLMEQLAVVANNPALTSKFENLKIEVQQVSKQMDVWKERLAGVMSDGLTEFFSNGILKCTSLKDAFLDMISSMMQSIQKLLAQQLVQYMIQGMFGGRLGGVSGFASGGYISGPGTGTSDSIPALLSNGEYVIKASSVRRYGQSFFDLLNMGIRPSGIPRFATGGLVGSIPDKPKSETSRSNQQSGDGINIVNVVDKSMVQDYLSSSAGNKVILNVIQNNRNMIRRLIQ
ncbi:MAG: tape measure protein [bacterium]